MTYIMPSSSIIASILDMQELFDIQGGFQFNFYRKKKNNLQKCYMKTFLKSFTVLLKQETQELLSNTIESNDPIVL